MQICAGYSAARGVQVLTTVRAKFYFLYICMALFMAAVAVAVASFSWGKYSERQTLLEEYNVFRLSTKAIHMLQKERGLTVKSLFRPTPSNINELQLWRAETNAAILKLSNTSLSREISGRQIMLRGLSDSNAISLEDCFLEYSDIIYEIIATYSSDKSYEHIQHDHLFLSLMNLLMAREHLGKIRARISMSAMNNFLDGESQFYVKEKFGFYKISKEEFLKSLKGKYPGYVGIVADDEKVKKTEAAISLYLDGRQQEFDYDSWFGMSTGAMDVYYSVEGTLADTYGQYLKYEKRKAQLTGLLILCVTALVLLVSGLFVGRFIKSFSARLENIDDKMRFILRTHDYKIEITDQSHDEISGISNSLNSLLKFTNQLLEEKEKMASTDRLTGVHNRTKFVDIFNSEFQRFSRYKTPFSVIMMDIDHFKIVNDTYGHNVGDDVLVEVTSMASKIIRATDILVRWGGEEFVVLAPSSELHSAVALAEKLRSVIAEHSFPSGLKVTMSFGVAEIDESDSLKTIMARADAALYESKRTGRNKVCTFSAIK